MSNILYNNFGRVNNLCLKRYITSKYFQNVKSILFVLSIESPCTIARYFVNYYTVIHIHSIQFF